MILLLPLGLIIGACGPQHGDGTGASDNPQPLDGLCRVEERVFADGEVDISPEQLTVAFESFAPMRVNWIHESLDGSDSAAVDLRPEASGDVVLVEWVSDSEGTQPCEATQLRLPVTASVTVGDDHLSGTLSGSFDATHDDPNSIWPLLTTTEVTLSDEWAALVEAEIDATWPEGTAVTTTLVIAGSLAETNLGLSIEGDNHLATLWGGVLE